VTARGCHQALITATLPLLFAVSGCAPIGDDPKRTFSLPNDTDGPRLMRRCEDVDECRSPDEGELVQPQESLDFKLYYDEDRTYIVANAQGRTFGCLTVPLAAGVGPYPDSLSDLMPCPRGTPKTL
jgi:hypothetical protein